MNEPVPLKVCLPAQKRLGKRSAKLAQNKKQTALLLAPLTLTQMLLSTIKLLSTQLPRQQESLAVNMVRRFPHLGEANSIALDLTIRIMGGAQLKIAYRRIFPLRGNGAGSIDSGPARPQRVFSRMLITSTRETNGNWIVAIRNEDTGLFVNKAGTAQEVVSWLLNKAAENKEIDNALEKTIEMWRGNYKELFEAYVSATI